MTLSTYCRFFSRIAWGTVLAFIGCGSGGSSADSPKLMKETVRQFIVPNISDQFIIHLPSIRNGNSPQILIECASQDSILIYDQQGTITLYQNDGIILRKYCIPTEWTFVRGFSVTDRHQLLLLSSNEMEILILELSSGEFHIVENSTPESWYSLLGAEYRDVMECNPEVFYEFDNSPDCEGCLKFDYYYHFFYDVSSSVMYQKYNQYFARRHLGSCTIGPEDIVPSKVAGIYTTEVYAHPDNETWYFSTNWGSLKVVNEAYKVDSVIFSGDIRMKSDYCTNRSQSMIWGTELRNDSVLAIVNWNLIE